MSNEWLGSVVVAPDARGRRYPRKALSVIEYAVIDASLAWFVRAVTVDDSWLLGLHCPVRYLVRGNLGNKGAFSRPTHHPRTV